MPGGTRSQPWSRRQLSPTLSRVSWYTNESFHHLRPGRLSASEHLPLCLGGAFLAHFQLAVRTFPDVPRRPAVTHAAGEREEIGIGLDDREMVSATGHGGRMAEVLGER